MKNRKLNDSLCLFDEQKTQEFVQIVSCKVLLSLKTMGIQECLKIEIKYVLKCIHI